MTASPEEKFGSFILKEKCFIVKFLLKQQQQSFTEEAVDLTAEQQSFNVPNLVRLMHPDEC